MFRQLFLGKMVGVVRAVMACATVAVLTACGSSVQAPKPTELAPNAALIGVRLAWSAKVGEVKFPLAVKSNAFNLTLASSDGVVSTLDARTGGDVWRTSLGTAISAGAGSDGRYAAVVSQANELVLLDNGREVWRQKLAA